MEWVHKLKCIRLNINENLTKWRCSRAIGSKCFYLYYKIFKKINN